MKTEDFDKASDRGESILAHLGAEARHLGVTRQSIIKLWLAEGLE